MKSHNFSNLPLHTAFSSSLLPPSNQIPPLPSISSIQQSKMSQLTPFNSQKLTQSSNPRSFDPTIPLTKPIRHGHSDFTNSHPKAKEILHSPSMGQRRDFLRHNDVVSNHQAEMPSVSFDLGDRWGLSSFRKILPDKKGERIESPPEWVKNSTGFGLQGNRLFVPGGCNSRNANDLNELLQQLLRQLEYHKTQQSMIERMLWHLQIKQSCIGEHRDLQRVNSQFMEQIQQRQQTDHMLHYLHESNKQMCTVPTSAPYFEINQNIKFEDNISSLYESNNHLDEKNGFYFPKLKVEDDDQYVKLEYEAKVSTDEKSSDEAQNSNDRYDSLYSLENEIKLEPLAEAPLEEPRQCVKKKRNSSYPVDYFGILGKNLIGKPKEEPRRKNKWQQLAGGDEPETHNREKSVPLVKESTEIEKQEDEPVREKIIPYIEDESNIDYNYLLSIKITNDPTTLGYENPTQGFVVVSGGNEKYDENKDESETKETRVGNKYQAVIPELQDRSLRLNHRRKLPRLLWNPQVLLSIELERYFNDLCKILNCKRINEERALKLLKRKNYKKERVKVNISKNEKFYSSFLVVDMTRMDTEQNIPECQLAFIDYPCNRPAGLKSTRKPGKRDMLLYIVMPNKSKRAFIETVHRDIRFCFY